VPGYTRDQRLGIVGRVPARQRVDPGQQPRLHETRWQIDRPGLFFSARCRIAAADRRRRRADRAHRLFDRRSRGRGRGRRRRRRSGRRWIDVAGRGRFGKGRNVAGDRRRQVAVDRARRAGPRHYLPFFDRSDTLAEQRLAVEDLLQVAAQLDLEAIAAKSGAHVEMRTRRDNRFLRAFAARRVEAEPQRSDHPGDTELLQTQLLARTQRLPPRLEVE